MVRSAFLAAAVFLSVVAAAQVQPDPEAMALYEQVLQAYAQFSPWEALLVQTMDTPWESLTFTMRAWYAEPWLKQETATPYGEDVVLIDYARGLRVTPVGDVWLEEEIDPEDLPPRLPIPIAFLPGPLQILSWRREASEDGAFLVLEGTTTGLGVESKVVLWIDPETLQITRGQVEWLSGVVTWSFHVQTFVPGAEVPPEVFQPSPTARVVRLSPVHREAQAIAERALSQLRGLSSFYALIVSLEDGALIRIWYSDPFFREELQLGLGTSHVSIMDMERGVRYVQRYGGDWEAWELRSFPTPLRPLMALGLLVLERRYVDLAEDAVGDRSVWRVTSQSPEWGIEGAEGGVRMVLWVDPESYAIVQYQVTYAITGEGRVEQETRRILEFQPGVEVPADKFAVPEGIPVRPFPSFLQEEVGPGEKAEVGVQWEPYSAARLEEAQAQGQYVLLYFTAAWCLPCKSFEEEAWRDVRVIEEAERFVRLKVDLTNLADPQVRELQSRYKARAVPLTLILDPMGNEVGRLIGAVPTWELLLFLRSVK